MDEQHKISGNILPLFSRSGSERKSGYKEIFVSVTNQFSFFWKSRHFLPENVIYSLSPWCDSDSFIYRIVVSSFPDKINQALLTYDVYYNGK